MIKQFFPKKQIFYYLSDATMFLEKDTNNKHSFCIAIETNEKHRRFIILNFIELLTVFDITDQLTRHLYEVITANSIVKIYIDFEYLISSNPDITNQFTGAQCVLNILQYFFTNKMEAFSSKDDFINSTLENYLVLSAYVSSSYSNSF